MDDELTSTLLLEQTWHCHCAPSLCDFSAERLKAAIRSALPALCGLREPFGLHSDELRPCSRVRPCHLLGDLAVNGEVSASFMVAHRDTRRFIATGVICNGQDVALFLLSGLPEVRSVLVGLLGAEFGITLQPLSLAPWQLAMATAFGLALLKSNGPLESSLELKLDSGITLGFEANVLAELPTSSQVAEVAGREMLRSLYEIAAERVLPLPYEELQLRGLLISKALSLDHQGTLELRSQTLVPSVLYMLMSIAEELVLGTAAPYLEEDSVLSRKQSSV